MKERIIDLVCSACDQLALLKSLSPAPELKSDAQGRSLPERGDERSLVERPYLAGAQASDRVVSARPDMLAWRERRATPVPPWIDGTGSDVAREPKTGEPASPGPILRSARP